MDVPPTPIVVFTIPSYRREYYIYYLYISTLVYLYGGYRVLHTNSTVHRSRPFASSKAEHNRVPNPLTCDFLTVTPHFPPPRAPPLRLRIAASFGKKRLVRNQFPVQDKAAGVRVQSRSFTGPTSTAASFSLACPSISSYANPLLSRQKLPKIPPSRAPKRYPKQHGPEEALGLVSAEHLPLIPFLSPISPSPAILTYLSTGVMICSG